MPTENRIFIDPESRLNLNLYAKVFGTVTTPHSTGTINGTSLGNGYYQFAGLDTDLTYTIYEEALAGTKAATDDWLAVLPPDVYGLAAAIRAKTDLIGTGSATVSAPITLSGNLATLVIGDDYKTTNGRALVFVVQTTITAASCTMVIYQSSTRAMSLTGTVANATGTVTLTFEIDSADWAPMTNGDAEFNVEMLDGAGNEITPIHSFTASRKVRLIHKYT